MKPLHKKRLLKLADHLDYGEEAAARLTFEDSLQIICGLKDRQ